MPDEPDASAAAAATAARISASLDALWVRNLPIILARLELFDRAAAAAHSRHLQDDLRMEAASAAHKLAGSMGMFGHAQATMIARELERTLLAPAPDPDSVTTLSTQLRAALPLP